MNLVRLCLAYLRFRLATTMLNLALVTAGVAMVCAILSIGHQLRERVEREIAGVDLVVGAKGSPLQLILATVLQIDVPTGNIRLSDVEFLRRHPLVAATIPMAMGDNVAGFRLIGTEPSWFAARGVELASGRIWEAPMEIVLGAEVARATGLRLGSSVLGSHGLVGGMVHADHPYTVVGIAKPTGTSADRLVITALESVWRVHEHATGPRGPEAHEEGTEITALLVRYRSPLAAVQLPRLVNAQPSLVAAVPAFEAARLLSIVGFGLDALRTLGFLLLVTAAAAVFVALTNALFDRRADLALMRVLGATRGLLVRSLLLESVLLVGTGLAAGVLIGHVSLELVAQLVPQARASGLTGFAFAPEELWLIPAAMVIATGAAAIPAIRVYRADLVRTLARG